MIIKIKIPLWNGKTREVKAEFLKLKLSELKPYSNNAKNHPLEQIEMIKKSIIETGFRNPIEIDEKNVILSGHGRLEACKGLLMEEVLVLRYLDLTKKEKVTYRNSTNRIADFGDYDIEKLQKDFEITGIGELEQEIFDFAIPNIEVEESIINTEISRDLDSDIDPNINGAVVNSATYEETEEEIEGTFTEIDTGEPKKEDREQTKGIQIPVKNEIYDELFKIYRELLEKKVDIGGILLQGLKDYKSDKS